MNSRGFYIALEQRILLDAAGMTTAVETLPDQIDTAVAASEDAQEQEAVQGLLNAFAEQPTDSGSSSEASLIFVDSRVENPEQLLGNSIDKSAEIYIIEEGVDGLAYIAEILGQQESKVGSLHIISHGSSGELLLGSNRITTESLSGDDGQYLAMMSERLDNEADILFYGCNVAEGDDGKRFIEKFALITDADVAASTDLTGSVALGGDADLEYSTGNIEAKPVIELASLENYSELLGTPDAGGNVTLTNLSGATVSITEDSAAPGAANVRLTPTTLNDGADPDPTEVRVISVTGGTLTQTDGSAIVLGAAGTKLGLTGGNYDFRFTPDANRDTDVTFSYVVVESGGELNSSASTATVSVTAANDAPTASNVSLPNVDEDTSAPTGTAISTLFSGSFTDVDTGGSLGGVLVVSNSADLLTQGNWQYSSDGTNFFDIGAVADDGTALALSASTTLRFVPAADYNGAPPALTVRAVDDTQTQYTSGGARVTVDSSANGGSTAFAAATTTVSVTVNAVNDAPEITEAGEFADITEDLSPNSGVTVSSFLNGLVTGSDNNANDIGLAITATNVAGLSGSGSDWQFSTNGGTTWNDVGAVSNTSALLLSPAHLIRFNPAVDQSGNGELTYKVWDGSTGTGGAKENLTLGDANRVSSAAFTSSIAVTAVNDDPANLTSNTKTIEENTTYVLTNTDLAFTAKAGAPNEQTADQIIYQVTTLAGSGNVQKQYGSTWATLAVGSLFSQSDIDSGDVRYVHTGAELSANATDSFKFTVRDGAGSELTNQSFDLTITNVNAPLSLTNTTISVNEFITAGDVNVINIGTSDADNNDVSLIQFTLKSLPNASLGKLEIDKGSGFVDAAVNDTFTKADLNAGKIRYVHNGTEPVDANASTTFTVDATDNSPAGINTAGNPSPSTVTNQTITLNIQPKNDTPEKVVAVPVIPEGGTLVIDENFIDFTDPDSASTQFTVIIDTVPTKGALFLDGVRLGAGSMLLRSDLTSDKLEYRHFDSNPDADANTIDDTFTYTMRDRDGATITASQGIKITPNDADSGGDTSSGVGANNGGEALLAEGSTYTITDANLARTNSGANYSVTALPSTGALQLNGVDLVVGVNDTFTAADITAGNLKYIHNDTENFTDTFTFTADGATGNVFNFQITPVNEAPVINTPVAGEITITVSERDDTSTAYSNTADVSTAENAFRLTTTQLSGSDVDAPPNTDLYYELTGKPPGGEILIHNGTEYVALTKDRFTVQDVIDGKVAYFHTGGDEPDAANDKFTVKLTDGGATDSAPKTINITVNNVNDAPTTNGNSFTINEGGTQALQSILNGKYDDVDADDTPANLTLELTAIPNASSGKIQDYSGGGAGVTLSIGSTFTKSDLDAGHIVYEHAGGELFTDSFAYKAVDDGTPNLESSPDTVNIFIRPINDDPTIGTNLGIVTGDSRYENETFTITSTQLAGADGDHDSTPTASQLKQIQYRLTSSVTSGTLTLNGKVLGAGSVFTQADVNNGLLKYQHTKESSLTDSFNFTISDGGGGNEPTGTFNIALYAVNDSPELVVPKAVTLLEEGVKTITGIVVSDVDAATNDIVTTLTVTKGTITFANTSLGGAVVAGAGGASLTITGTVTEVNAMLAQGVQYTGAANEVGADTLSINVNDQGSTGTDPSVVNALVGRTFTDTVDSGGAGDQQVAGTVGITIKPVNDAPVIVTFPGAQTLAEDTSKTFGGLSFSDVDVATGNVSVTLKASAAATTGGIVTVNGTVAGVTVSNNGSGTVTVTGSLADVNTLLNAVGSLTYAAKANYNGSDTVVATISDLGNTGAGGAKSATQSVAITITEVNDAPDVSTPVTATGNEDTDIAIVLSAISLDLTGNPNSTITGFTVTTLPNAAQGVLFKSDGVTAVVKDALLTKAEAEALIFKPVAEFNGATTFAYTATDGALTSAIQTGTITTNAVNDQPGLSVTSTGVTYIEGSGLQVSGAAVDLTTGAVVVTDIELITTDEDSFDGARLEVDRDGGNSSTDVFSIDTTTGGNTVITLSNASNDNSTITIAGDIIGTITNNSGGQIQVTFSALAEQSDVNTVAQAIYYRNTDDSPPATVNLDFRFSDGNSGSAQGSGGNKNIEATVSVAITPSNDAPVGKNGSFNSNEDAATPTTFTLSAANVLASDADDGSSVSYVAITGNAASANALTEGVWEYSTNAGGSWADVSTVSDTSAVVVPVGSLVRFVPVAHYNGVPGALSFRAVDNTSADITGTGVNVSANGGITAIDGAARTITATIVSINDAPVLAATQLSPSISESGSSTGSIPLLDSSVTTIATLDADATQFSGGSITVSLDSYVTGDVLSLAGFGAAQGVSSSTGGTASDLVINLNSNATLVQVNAMLAAIRYSHTGDNPTASGTDPSRVYSITLNDGGQSNGPSNTGTTGTPQNSNVLTGTITILNQNDSPVGSAASLSVAEDTTNPSGTLISSLGIYTDADGDAQKGIAVTANSANAATEGVWQYSSDAGTTWVPIATATDAASVVLQNTSLIRFVPAENFTGNSADSLSVRVLDNTYAGGYSDSTNTASGTPVTLSTSGGTGIEAFATVATAISINVTEVNDAPVLSDLGGTVAYTESPNVQGLGTAVLLDADAKIADIELSGLDNIADNDFDGATLTIERKAAANTDDVFAIEAGKGVSVAGSNIVIASANVATFTNVGGSMVITFVAGATDANVEAIMQQISFANKSDQPPATAVIEYTFNDKNTGDQGTGLNSSVKAEVTVNITATNDTPVATPDVASVTENSTTTTVSGNAIDDATADSDADGDDLDVSDITGPNGAKTDNGTTFTIPGTYGSLVINKETGAYTYSIDNTLPATQALDDSDTPVETFNYTVSDGNGASATSTIKVTINGDNDAPIANANTATIVEDTLTVSGDVITDATADSDVDDSDLDISAITGPNGPAVDAGGKLTIPGVYGSLELDKEDGTYTYTLNNGNNTVQALGVGESLTEAFTYTLTDGDETDTALLTVTINGLNDSPIGAAASLSVVEDTAEPSGTLISSLSIYTDRDTDPQSGIAVTANIADATTEGVWQYSSDAGTTWVPIAAATDAASVVLQNTSLIRFVPVANFTGNSADSLSVRVLDNTYAGGYSDSTNTASGTPAILNTSAAPTGVQEFAATSTAISINVTEVNDTPVFSDLGGTVAYTESANVAGLGTAVLLDADAKIADIELSGLDNIADNDFDGATLTIERKAAANTDDVFAIEAGKGVSVAGSNIVIASANVATFTNVGGSMVITFAAGATDANVEAIMQQISFANKSDQPPATAVIEYTFNDKNTGDQGTGLNSTVKAEVTVNITATNDTPVATPDTGAVTENSGTTTVSGNAIDDATADSDADGDDLDISDITGPNGAKTDNGTTFTIPGTYGSLVINKETGAYVYTIDNSLAATQALDDGDVPVETFNYTVSDGNGASATSTIKVTVNGDNDAPVANPNTDAITEDTATKSGNLITDVTADSDVDDSDLDISAVTGPGAAATDSGGNLTVAGNYGTLVINKETGAYTYTLSNGNNTVQALGVGESLTESFTYTLTDNDETDTATLTMTINGRNDSPVGSAASLSVVEDTTNPSGTLISSLGIYTDADGDAQKGIAVTANSADATTEGVWQYSSDAGTTWVPIAAATDAASVVLQNTSLIRFVPVANFTGNSADSLSVRVLDNTYAGGYSDSTNTASGTPVTLSTSGGTGIEAFATVATAISINVTEVNDAPVLSDLGGTVAYTESANVAGLGTAVLLDADAKIADIELSGLDNIADNDFDGATLTIERKGTANTDDVFVIEAGKGVSVAGSNIVIASTNVATFTNVGGSMVITFVAGATDANVEAIMQQISFANKSDQPPATAVIEYTFNDKNTGDQGTGLNSTVKAEVTVNITATNDTPVATPDTGAVTENSGTTTVSGNAIDDATADSDADGDDLDISDITGPNGAKTDNGTTFTIPGTYGSLVINKETGAYVYTIDNSLAATQALDDGDVPVETFNYTVSDGNGASATSTIKVTVNGDNDAPIANPNTDAITEDTASKAGNLITDATADSDVDDSNLDISAVTGPGAAATDSGGNLMVVGDYGTLVINKGTGAYTYSLNNSNATVIALGVGESLTESFTYTLTDGDATDTATFTMTINGRNDSPVGSAASLSVVEDTTNPSGTLISSLGIYTDADGDAQKGIAVTANSADATTEGVWQYSSDAGTTWVPIAAATDAASVVLQNTSLIRFVPVANFTGNSADSLSVRVLDNTYSGTYSDSTGSVVTLSTSGGTGVEAFATVATAISINVTEVNDAPVLSDLGGTVAYTESANVAGLGTAVLLDADAKIADIELSGLDNIADNDFDGATLTIERKGTANTDDVFAIEAGKGVSVAGSNIVIASTNVATFTNVGGSMVITFAAGATDANVEAIMQQISFANKSDQPPATAVIEYTFNDKNTGDQGTGLNSTVKAEVTVNITATNDTPVATPDTGTVTENSGTTTVSGNAITDATADSDADGDDIDVTDITGPNGAKTDTDSNTTFTIAGDYGSLVINKETGAYVYTIDNSLAATQALDDGDVPVETFNYTVSDGNGAFATSTIKVTVNGDNDAPVANLNTASITENTVNITGNLITDATADSDVDDTDLDISAVVRVAGPTGTSDGTNLTVAGNFGTLVINESTGAYTYTLDNTNAAVKGLGIGQSTTETFTYTLTDKTDTDTANLKITINGANNLPVARVDTASVTENSATTTATGNALTDATADSDIDGDDLDVSAITGPNGASTDDGTSLTIEGVYGSMVINKETGAYTYTLDNTRSATQALDDGDTPTEVFNYTISDGQNGTASSTITVTVTGANDAPVATTNTISTTIDDTNVTGNLITDSIADSDVDDTNLDISAVTGANASSSAGGNLTIVGDFGTLVINEGSGAYTYTLDKTNTSVTGLGIGQSLTDTFTYTLTDGTDTDTSTLKVTVNLNNVSPVANADSGTLTEDSATSASAGNVFANDTDGDGDNLDVTGASGPNGAGTDSGSSITVPGIYGSLTINKDTGAYTYTLDNSKTITQQLDSGDFPTEVFNYAITDGRGGTDSSAITITIEGVNDTPTTTAAIPQQTSIDGASSISLNAVSLAGFQDVDDTLTYTASNLPAGLTISSTGIISGSISKSASQGGNSGVYSVTVTATDGTTTKDSVFNWVVTNPQPIANDNSGSVSEDGLAVKGGNLITEAAADSDPDGDVLSIGAVSSPSGTAVDNGTTITITGTYGSLVVNKTTGIYQYSLNNSNAATNALDLGDSVSEVFTYTLNDSDGGSDTANLVITVNGANDAPIIVSPLADASVAGTSPVSIDVSGSFSDVDADDSITFAAFGLPGGLSIDSSTGLITGTPTAGSANGGANGNGVFSVTVSGTDSNGRLVSDTFDLTIGNTPPVAVSAGFGLTAGGGAITGNASGTDPDGDTIASFNLVSGVSEGSLSFNSDGSFSFDEAGAFDDLAAGVTRTVSFTYTVTDANGALSSPATISFTVTGVENVTVIDPGTGVTDPGTGVTDPGTGVTDPGTGVTDPGTGVTDPGTGVTDPGTGVTDPGTGVTDPGTGVTDPGTGVTDPGTGVTDPGTGVVTDPGTGVVTDPGTGVVTDPGVPVEVDPPFVDPSGFETPPVDGAPAAGPGNGGAVTVTPGGGDGGGAAGNPVNNPDPTIPSTLSPGFTLGLSVGGEVIQFSLTLTLADQLVTTRGQGLFSIPANAFDNGGNGPISVEVGLADGSALPDYIVFDPDGLTFIVDGVAAGEAGATEIIIRVTGSDGNGGSDSGTFIIVVVAAEDGDPALPDGATPANNDQGLIQYGESSIEIAAALESDRATLNTDNVSEPPASFFDKLDVAANEDNFENKVKQLLNDIVHLIS